MSNCYRFSGGFHGFRFSGFMQQVCAAVCVRGWLQNTEKGPARSLERSITAVFGTNIFFADVLGIKGRNDDATEAERTQRKIEDRKRKCRRTTQLFVGFGVG